MTPGRSWYKVEGKVKIHSSEMGAYFKAPGHSPVRG